MKTNKKLLRFILIVMIVLTAMSAVSCQSQSQTQELVSTIYDRTIRQKKVTLSNGTVAYKWISGEFTSAEKKQIDDYFIDEYDVKKKRAATVKYNCHSYAWYSTSSSNKYWINDPSIYMENAKFICTQTSMFNYIPTDVEKNYRAVVKIDGVIVHSAIVNNVDYKSEHLISKWGYAGVFVHSIKRCPYYKSRATKIEYYKK